MLWRKILFLLYSFQNYYRNQIKHTPHGGSGYTTKERTREDSEPVHQKIDCYPFPSCLTPPLPWLQTTYWKKVSPVVFRQILPKILPMVHIFSFIITTYLKKFIGIKTLGAKQYPAELSLWSIPTIFPILPKMFHLLSFCLLSHHVWIALPFPKTYYLGKPCRWENPASFPAPKKSPSPNSNFHIITQYKLHL